MSEYNITELFENSEELKPMVELVQAILELNEKDLNDQIILNALTTVNNVLTPKIKQTAIDELIKSFVENNFDLIEAQELIETTKKDVLAYINTFALGKYKRSLLDGILKIFFDLFDQGLTQYAGYSFTLPIKVEGEGKIPTYAHPTDAAADIYAAEEYELLPHSLSNKIKTNIKIALPEGWAAAILPRSSIGAKTGLRLSNSIGIIDSDYRGEIGVLYDNISDSAYTIKAGDRIAQMIIFPVHHFKAVEVNTLEETERGEGGFGSSGK